jgi:hypothetical protein
MTSSDVWRAHGSARWVRGRAAGWL